MGSKRLIIEGSNLSRFTSKQSAYSFLSKFFRDYFCWFVDERAWILFTILHELFTGAYKLTFKKFIVNITIQLFDLTDFALCIFPSTGRASYQDYISLWHFSANPFLALLNFLRIILRQLILWIDITRLTLSNVRFS